MLNYANIYIYILGSGFCLPFEEFHKPAVPRYLGTAGFAVLNLMKGWIL